MNAGIFGFFAGANITVDTQVFEPAGAYIWRKPLNAKLCLIDGTGGGQGGGGGGTATGNPGPGVGGAAGCAFEILLEANYLNEQEVVTVGAGGAFGAGTTASLPTVGGEGGETTFAGLVWAGGYDRNTPRNPFIGNRGQWGAGKASGGVFATAVSGGHGAGGGGQGTPRGGSTLKKYGGRPRYFKFAAGSNAAANMTDADGIDGIPGNLAGGGDNASVAAGGFGRAGEDAFRTVDGYGEGGGGGGRGDDGTGGTGGNGIRGSGGGGGGAGAQGGGRGGQGGDGFLRIVTFCWE